jgi:hypothetical protein
MKLITSSFIIACSISSPTIGIAQDNSNQNNPLSSFLKSLSGSAKGGSNPNTFENPRSSKSPDTWTDLDFLPEIKNNSARLRIGISGVGNFQAYPQSTPVSQGSITCDLEYLYFAKSGTSPEMDELEDCVIKEELIQQKLSGTKRDINNAFVRKDIIEEWTPKINERIAHFKNIERFYFRPSKSQILPYSQQAGGFPASIVMGNYAVTSYYRGRHDHAFIGYEINPVTNTLETVMALPDELSRSLERAARQFAHIDYGLTEFYFKLDSVGFQKIPNKLIPIRVYRISDTGWSFKFTDPNNKTIKATLSTGVPGR